MSDGLKALGIPVPFSASQYETILTEVARRNGVRAGLFRPVTLWPFPEQAFREHAARASHVLVVEMNAGQLSLEIERLCAQPGKVTQLTRVTGQPIGPAEILATLQERARHGQA